MGKPKPKQPVAEYYMSIHYGVCLGPVDAIEAITVDDKIAWQGEHTTTGPITIHRPDLFGGVTKEGGMAGIAYVLRGDPNQVMPEGLAARFNLTSETCPAYRGITSIFFVGQLLSKLGFYWTANQPYLRGVGIKCRRIPRSLNSTYAQIGPDANPAHIIYECLTSQEWGMGGSPAIINTDNFNAVSQVLYEEEFGLSMIWRAQTPVETFISEVLDHIQGTLYVNPRSGLYEIKLIRDDYDEEELFELTPDNCTVTTFSRKTWAETINEITVTWTDPVNDQDATITMHDLANIAMQGAIVSDSRNYYGVRNKELAAKICARDIRTAAAPLAIFEIQANREAWDLLPGQVVKLTYPEYGIDGVVIRITGIDYGRVGDPTIKINATEDIFALPTSAYAPPPGTGWVDPSEDPSPLTYSQVFTLPAFLASSIPESEGLEHPEVFAGILGGQTGGDTAVYSLYGQVTLPNGGLAWESFGNRSIISHGELVDPLEAEAVSVVESFGDVTQGEGPVVSGFVMLGEGGDEDMEIALIAGQDESGWTLNRGVLDTIPRAWPSGTPLWFVSVNTRIDDDTIYSEGSTPEYKLLSRTSRGTLSLDEAPVVSATLTGRPWLPLRPANVSVGGVTFGTLALMDAKPEDSIEVTWSNRNRISETEQVLSWTDGNVTPEEGQSTVIEVLDNSGNVLTTYTDLTGTSAEIQVEDFDGLTEGAVRVSAARDGLMSLQNFSVPVTIMYYGFATARTTMTFGGSATGRRILRAEARTTMTFGGTAYSDIRVKAATTMTFSGSATAKLTSYRAAATTMTFGGSASGKIVSHRTAAATMTFGGSAAGRRILRGEARTTMTFGGRASVGLSARTTMTFGGSATGRRILRGEARTTMTFGGSANVGGSLTGEARTTMTFGGSATGRLTLKGAATTSMTFGSEAIGRVIKKAVAAASMTFGGSATGRRILHGEALTTMTFGGSADGSTGPEEFKIRSFSTQTITDDAVTVAKPAGTKEGDLLVAFFATFVPDGDTNITRPADWETRETMLDDDFDFFSFVDYKVAGPSEPSDYTWTFDGGEGTARVVVVAIAQADTEEPFAASALSEGYGTTPTSPAVSAGDSGAIILRGSSHANTNGQTEPSGTIKIGEVGAELNQSVAYSIQEGGNADAAQWSADEDSWAASTVVVRRAIPIGPTTDSLWAWHDASDLATITTETGGRVTNVADKSGNGRFAYQGSGTAARPYSGSRTLNGLNVLDFQGAQRLAFDSGVYLGSGASTALIVYGCDNTDFHRLFTGRTTTQPYALNLTVNTTLVGDIVAINHNTAVNFIGVAGTPDTQPHIAGWRRDGSVVQAMVDGVLGSNGGATNVTLAGNMVYGARFNSPNWVEHMDGFVAEALFFNKALTDDELARNVAYLKNKWGIA